MRASLACSGVLLVLFGSRAAQANDEATAEALFEQGRDAMRSGAYTKACLMFEESYRLVHGDGTKFNLGECYEKVGRTASAWAAFRDVAATSKLAGQKEREALAKARAEALFPKLCRMSIEVGSDAPTTVLRDGEEVGRGQWGVPLPIDPGVHRVEASAPGKEPFRTNVATTDCPKTVSVAIPQLSSEQAHGTPPPSPPRGNVEAPLPKSGPTRPAIIWTSLGLGAVTAGFGTYFGVRAWSLRNDSNDGHCSGNVCDDIGRDLRSNSLSAGRLATAFFITSGVFLLTSTVVWLATKP